MKWIETKVIFDSDKQPMVSDLISNAFHDLGVQGVVLETLQVDSATQWAHGEILMPAHDAVIGYLPKKKKFHLLTGELEEQLKRIGQEHGVTYRIVYREIDEKDWAESWKAYYWPEKISDKIVVKPTWRRYDPDPEEIVIEIDPGMAFGTGTHPTTSQCMKLIEELAKPGGEVLDVGTGSGILMVTAAKLGAKTVWGIDNDPIAIEVAEKNLLQNNIAPEKFTLTTGHLVDGIDKQFGLVTANLSTELIIDLLDYLHKVLATRAIFICSGIYEENKDKVLEKILDKGFEILNICEKEKWLAIGARIKKSPFPVF